MKVSIRTNKLKKGNSYTVFVDYGIVNGNRKREPLETFSKKTDAEKYKTKIQSQINSNVFINIPSITFSEAIDEWMENYVKNKCEPNTYANYEQVNKAWLKPCLGHIPLKIISSPEGINIINNYYHYLRFEVETDTKGKRKNLSYNTIKHHKAQISGLLTYFSQCNKIATNICTKTVIPKTEKEDFKDILIENSFEDFDNDDFFQEEFITPEQAITILNLFMNTSMMLPVAFSIFLGLRRSEFLGILKNKINKEKNYIIINATTVLSGSKMLFKKKNKNKNSTRRLYIPKLLMKLIELDEKRQQKNRILYKEKYIDSNFLCVMDNGQPIKPNYISQTFRQTVDEFIEKQKKINPNFHFPHITIHKLRHLNISVLLENGAELIDVKDSAGHSNINTTMIYTHNYIKNKKEIAQKTDEIYKDLLTKISY